MIFINTFRCNGNFSGWAETQAQAERMFYSGRYLNKNYILLLGSCYINYIIKNHLFFNLQLMVKKNTLNFLLTDKDLIKVSKLTTKKKMEPGLILWAPV